jgi:hypothetical protein
MVDQGVSYRSIFTEFRVLDDGHGMGLGFARWCFRIEPTI